MSNFADLMRKEQNDMPAKDRRLIKVTVAATMKTISQMSEQEFNERMLATLNRLQKDVSGAAAVLSLMEHSPPHTPTVRCHPHHRSRVSPHVSLALSNL